MTVPVQRPAAQAAAEPAAPRGEAAADLAEPRKRAAALRGELPGSAATYM